jgi:hypothetical protein
MNIAVIRLIELTIHYIKGVDEKLKILNRWNPLVLEFEHSCKAEDVDRME